MTEEQQELYDEINKLFHDSYDDNSKVKTLQALLEDKDPRYSNALRYSTEVGKMSSKALQEYAESLLGIDDGYPVIMQFLENNNYALVSDFTKEIQRINNEKNGIGMNAISAPFDRDRASGIAHNATHAESVEDARKALGVPIENLTDAVSDATIYSNAEFQYKSGMDVKIVRIRTGSFKCSFCSRLAGTYGYRSKKSFDAFDSARHENCKCIVLLEYQKGFKEYKVPSTSGKRETVTPISLNYETGGTRNEKPLTEKQISEAIDSARRQGYNGDIQYSNYSPTSLHVSTEGLSYNYLVIGTDAYPGTLEDPNSRVSLDGAMAHEVVGHYRAYLRGTTQKSIALEEAQASIRASKFGIGLSDEERKVLFEDGLNRLKKNDLSFDDVKDSLDIWEA